MTRQILRMLAMMSWLLAAASAPPVLAAEAGSADELRNTVVNLLEALIQKGVLTREQAQSLVSDAQAKAEATADAEAAAAAATEAAERDAVRVTHVPEIVREQIASDVSNRMRQQVTDAVVARARRDGWGVPGALPEWIRSARLYADVRARAENSGYSTDNAQSFYLDFNAVNRAGGIGRAGLNALLNTSQGRPRLVGRARVGLNAQVGEALQFDLRLVTGNAGNPVSTNQGLGTYGQRWTGSFDRAAVRWAPTTPSKVFGLDFRGGRMANPFVTAGEMIWDVDVALEGLSTTWNWNHLERVDRAAGRKLFVTMGAFPLQEVELASRDKWLYAAQLGTDLRLGSQSRLSFSGAYYNFANVAGVRNALDSSLLDYTAPPYLSKGNTLFDIRNDADIATNLFALAGDYELVSGLLSLDLGGLGSSHLILSGEYVSNVGWDSALVRAKTGRDIAKRTSGYEIGLSLGRAQVSSFGDWRFGAAYRYLERDAVLDAFTDSDFRLGGTDVKGYLLSGELGVGRSALLRLRYMSGNEIDGAPLGVDVVQLDLVGQL